MTFPWQVRDGAFVRPLVFRKPSELGEILSRAYTPAAHVPFFGHYGVRSVKQECLSKLILFGERSLQRALTEFIAHYHPERNHQGKGNVLLFPAPAAATYYRTVRCRERIGGLLRYYCRAA